MNPPPGITTQDPPFKHGFLAQTLEAGVVVPSKRDCRTFSLSKVNAGYTDRCVTEETSEAQATRALKATTRYYRTSSTIFTRICRTRSGRP